MTWTAASGHVYATGEVVLASTLNTYVKDNLTFLGGDSGALVATAQTTATATYTDLATVGPAVTVDTLTSVIVIVTALMSSTTSLGNSEMGYAVSGATTVAAADAKAIQYESPQANGAGRQSAAFYHNGLNAGSNTFTAKYRAGNGTCSWTDRNIAVLPLTV